MENVVTAIHSLFRFLTRILCHFLEPLTLFTSAVCSSSLHFSAFSLLLTFGQPTFCLTILPHTPTTTRGPPCYVTKNYFKACRIRKVLQHTCSFENGQITLCVKPSDISVGRSIITVMNFNLFGSKSFSWLVEAEEVSSLTGNPRRHSVLTIGDVITFMLLPKKF